MNTKTLLLSLITLASLNANTIDIKMPKVPEAPEVPQLNVSGSSPENQKILQESTQKTKVVFSNEVAPVEVQKKSDVNKTIGVGDVKDEMISAYLQSPLLSKEEVTSLLKKAGFTIISASKVDKKGITTSIVFTNDKLIKTASQKNRGFASVLRATIDKKDKLINITNPLYISKSFLQKNYDEKVAQEALISLRDAFTNLENSKQELKFRILDHYQFMAGMPKYEDMQIIKKAPQAKLVQKAKASKKVQFVLKLTNGVTLIGLQLSSRTTRFIKKAGYTNAGLLPYPILIENGEIKILDPKYYIAIMYPMLKMSQFMKIATVPGAINKEVDRLFR